MVDIIIAMLQLAWEGCKPLRHMHPAGCLHSALIIHTFDFIMVHAIKSSSLHQHCVSLHACLAVNIYWNYLQDETSGIASNRGGACKAGP